MTLSWRKIPACACIAIVLMSPLPNGASGAGPGVNGSTLCGREWKNVQSGGTGYDIYNDDFGATTCIANDGNAGFAIYYSAVHGGYQAYPDISSGWAWGVAPRHGYHYPVQARSDGDPRSSVTVHLANSGTYNAAYDIWFSTYAQTNGQDNAAEVMIWLDCHDNCIGQQSPVVSIDGIAFYKDSWITHHNGQSWRYTAFVAVRHRSSVQGLRLNPFIADAGVNPDWYLTSIDFGFELASGGRGLRVDSYSLTGVR
jgi:hypothetical protein